MLSLVFTTTQEQAADRKVIKQSWIITNNNILDEIFRDNKNNQGRGKTYTSDDHNSERDIDYSETSNSAIVLLSMWILSQTLSCYTLLSHPSITPDEV